MSHHDFDMIETGAKFGNVTVTSYIIGFLLSLILTLSAYLLVANRVFTPRILSFVIVGLGIIQMVIQLLFFLHLGNESRPRWNLLAFLFMTLVTVLLVFGSLWIMYSLDDRAMPTLDMNLLHQEGR